MQKPHQEHSPGSKQLKITRKIERLSQNNPGSTWQHRNTNLSGIQFSPRNWLQIAIGIMILQPTLQA